MCFSRRWTHPASQFFFGRDLGVEVVEAPAVPATELTPHEAEAVGVA